MHASKPQSLSLVSVLLLTACATVPPHTAPTPQGDKSPWTERISPPVTQPTLFESPTVRTEARPIFIHQRLPETSIFAGGDFQVYALQLRAPITEKIAVIATKDGYIDFNPGAGSDQDGFADVAAGLKFIAIDDQKNGVLVTPGITFELDVGEHQVFQGNGDGLARPFVSAAWESPSLPELNILLNVGASLPTDGGDETHSIDYHAHIGYEVTPTFMPLVEVHGVTYTRNANNLGVGFEGGDLLNLGSTRVAGNSLWTGAIGGRLRVSDTVQFGFAWGTPLTNRHDLFKDRITIDCSISF